MKKWIIVVVATSSPPTLHSALLPDVLCMEYVKTEAACTMIMRFSLSLVT